MRLVGARVEHETHQRPMPALTEHARKLAAQLTLAGTVTGKRHAHIAERIVQRQSAFRPVRDGLG